MGSLLQSAQEAVKAADLLLRDGNFPLVILDLVLNAPEELRKIPQTNWYRLQRLVEAAPAAFLVLTRASMISSAQLKLTLDNAWRLADLEQEDSRAAPKYSGETCAGRKTNHGRSQLMSCLRRFICPIFICRQRCVTSWSCTAKPVALIDDQEKKATIIQLNAAAEETGVRIGMTPSQGLARNLQLVVKTRAHAQEKLLQEILLHFAGTLAPYVEATGPGISTVQFTDTKNLAAKVTRVIAQLADC